MRITTALPVELFERFSVGKILQAPHSALVRDEVSPADHWCRDSIELDQDPFAPCVVEINCRNIGEQVDAERFAAEHQKCAWVLELVSCEIWQSKPEAGECL